MNRLLNYADIFIIAPCYLAYLWTADKFLKKYMETSRKNETLFVGLTLLGWLFLNVLNRQYFALHFFFLTLENIWFVGLVVLFFRESWEKKLLAAAILMTILRLAANIAEPMISCLILFYKHTIQKMPESFVNEWEAEAICYIVFLLVILAVHWLSGRLSSVFCEKPGKWYVLLAAPLLVVISVFDVANWGACYGIMVRSGGNMGLYYDQIFSYTEFCALAVIFMSATGFYLFVMDRIYLEQKKNGQYHAQIVAYKMLEEQYSRSERLRHDLKNHIIALSGLWEDQEWEELGDYLKRMENSGELGAHEEATGSRVVDALLHQKRKTAKDMGIIWESDVQIPKLCNISEFDLCVLFGNMLDNAVEACAESECWERRGKSQPFIRIRAGKVKKCFLLEMANSTNKTEWSKNGYREKENPQGYGIGLLNVGDVVNRYNGTMSTEIQDGVFTISVLIPLGESVHDTERTV